MAELTPQQEQQLQAAILAAYNLWLPAATAAVLGSYTRYGITPNPSAITATSAVWRSEVEQIVARALAPIGQEAYEDQVAGLATVPVLFLSTAAGASVAAATTAFLFAQIGQIQADLNQIIRTALNVAETAQLVAQYLNPNNSHWDSKSAQIAATEGERWVQAATLTGAILAQRADGQPRTKIWVSRDDHKVRPTHVAADGQQRPLNQPFNVGGFPMMYPLDPAAPAELVVNCRCKLQTRRVGA